MIQEVFISICPVPVLADPSYRTRDQKSKTDEHARSCQGEGEAPESTTNDGSRADADDSARTSAQHGLQRRGDVFVDPLFRSVARDPQARFVGKRNGHRWCHMWSEDVQALHALAAVIGMKREWFQDKPGFPHYDLTPRKRAFAISKGAVEKDLREWLRNRVLKHSEECTGARPLGDTEVKL